MIMSLAISVRGADGMIMPKKRGRPRKVAIENTVEEKKIVLKKVVLNENGEVEPEMTETEITQMEATMQYILQSLIVQGNWKIEVAEGDLEKNQRMFKIKMTPQGRRGNLKPRRTDLEFPPMNYSDIIRFTKGMSIDYPPEFGELRLRIDSIIQKNVVFPNLKHELPFDRASDIIAYGFWVAWRNAKMHVPIYTEYARTMIYDYSKKILAESRALWLRLRKK